MDKQRLFRFTKDCVVDGVTYHEGTYIEYFRGFVSMNGGILLEAYQKPLKNLIERELVKPEYLREEEPWF
jgi:hypothetical protein